MKIIAEIGQAHDGSLGIAHSLIDAVSKTGVDIIKFQTHYASEETTINEPWRVKFSIQDKTRFDYWQRMEFTEEQWVELKYHAEEVGLKFMSSPFSLYATELLKRVGVYAWKLASGEVNNVELLESIAETGQEIYLSTGMSKIEEIDKSVEIIKSYDLPLTVLQCTSMYPTPPDKVGLNLLDSFRDRYNCNVGLSDHSGEIFTGLAATVYGIDVLEIHVTFSKEMFGPDTSSSLTINELKKLVSGIHFIEKIISNDVNKDNIAYELSEMRNIFRKSIVYLNDIEKGSVLSKKHIGFKKPGTGVDPVEREKILGKTLKRSVKQNDQLSFEDLE